MNTQDKKTKNLEAAEAAIDKLAAQGADLVVLPEMFHFLGPDEEKITNAEPIPGPSIDRLQTKGKGEGIFLHCGSILEKDGEQDLQCLGGLQSTGRAGCLLPQDSPL